MADFEVTGVIDPARYSDNAVVVIEVPYRDMDDDAIEEIDMFRDGLAERLGMDVLVLVGARLARIEEHDARS